MSQPTDNLERRRKRALYRANHRGTREMDWLLGRFADQRLAAMAEAELIQFEYLLGLPDPELHGRLTARKTGQEPSDCGLIAEIRRFHGIDDD